MKNKEAYPVKKKRLTGRHLFDMETILDDGGQALLHYLKKVVMYIRYLWLRDHVREKQSADYDKAHNRKMNMWANY